MTDIKQYQFFNALTALPFVDVIYLYGSRARGDNAERADIDLAVACPAASDAEWLQIVDIIDEADTLLKIDCIRYDDIINEKLKQNIDTDGIILYQRD